MASEGYCLVCGCSKGEVSRLHYFPRELKKSRVWQERMGMVYTGESLRSHRICSRHFEPKCYSDSVMMKLFRDAVPTLYPAIGDSSSKQECVKVEEVDDVDNKDYGNNLINDETELPKHTECTSKSIKLEKTDSLLQEEKTRIKEQFTETLARVSSFDELELIKKNIASIQQSLRALKERKET